MKPSSEHVTYLTEAFDSLEKVSQLADLLTYAKRALHGEEASPITAASIAFYANPKNNPNRYREFSVSKKSGGARTIHAPCSGLKHILQPLNFVLQCLHQPHKRATGFVPGYSIVDNAQFHVGQRFVYNIDLKDFFHSFDRNRVKMGLMREPIGLKNEREPIAFLLASLCTHSLVVEGEKRIVLPQGAPTSPTITNILCQTLDRRLNGVAKRFGLNYSRYADDITFSGGYHFISAKGFQEELTRIVEEDQGLRINPRKTRLQYHTYRQDVTGLTVNKKTNVPKRYVKQLRMWIYLCERYGQSRAQGFFSRDYLAQKGTITGNVPPIENVIRGKLNYLKMVRGENDPTYRTLNARFEKLSRDHQQVEKLLNAWERHGIGAAILMMNQNSFLDNE